MNGSVDLQSRPILAGAAAGLLTGTVGLLVVPWGGMVGAVGGGVAAASLSDDGRATDVANAVAADLVSSAAVFLLFLAGYLGYLVAVEGHGAFTVAWVTLLYLVLAPLVAIPAATASAAVAAGSGAVTSVAKRARAG